MVDIHPKLVTSYLQPVSSWAPDSSGVEPLADNFLMNGQNTYNCTAVSSTWPVIDSTPCSGGQLYRTMVPSGKVIRLRLIGHSSFMSFWFSVDNHTLSVIEIDGIEIEPISTRGVYVNIGQRYSVIVNTNQTQGNYFMRATLPKTCFLPYAPYTNAALESGGYQVRGVLSYEGADADAVPIGVEGNVTNPYGIENNDMRGDVWEGCLDMPFDTAKPVRKEDAIEVDAANQHSIQFQFQQAGEVNRIFVNRVSTWSDPWLGWDMDELTLGNRRRGPPTPTRRSCGRPWIRASISGQKAATVTGISSLTSRCCLFRTRARASKW